MAIIEGGDLPRRQHVHSDRVRYIAWVLWFSGFPAAAIGRRVGLRPKQVIGLVQRNTFGDRATMTMAERQAVLKELLAIRADAKGENLLDRGVLGREAFIARPLSALSQAASARSMARATRPAA